MTIIKKYCKINNAMLHASNPIEKTICNKIILTALLLFIFLIMPIFMLFDRLPADAALRFIIVIIAFVIFLMILSKRIRKIIERHVSRPLNELSKLTDEVASGNYGAHAAVFSDTEVGSLAKNLNFMIEMTARYMTEFEENLGVAEKQKKELKSNVDELKTALSEFKKNERNFDRLISIDIKTPLNALINFFETLCFGDELFAKEYGVIIKTISAAAKNAYLDFLGAADFDGELEEKLKINRTRASFDSIIEQATGYYSPVIKIKNVNICRDISGKLDALNIDELKISAIVNNLVSNAVKFSPAGKTIVIAACLEGESLLFSIADKGTGLSEEIQEKTFLSDFCISTDGTFRESGFGMGLKLCKLFIEAHGGKFWFETSPEKGSVFYFKTPSVKINI